MEPGLKKHWVRRMLMGSHRVIAENPQTERTDKSLRIDGSGIENGLENRIKKLDKFVCSVHVALHRVSFSGKLRALDLMTELRVKIGATHNMFMVAKVLREPARQSLLSRVGKSVDDLEKIIAAHFDVEMS
jgi:hypothetical protein